MIKFYDTCAILEAQEKAFDEMFYISSITLQELEGIKTSGHKDEETKYSAREIERLLNANEDKYEVILYKPSMITEDLSEFELNNDIKIIASAKTLNDIIFITNDLACKRIASSVGLTVESFSDYKDEYTGFKEIVYNDDELADFYSRILYQNLPMNDIFTNEYIIIKNELGNIIDKYRWTGNKYQSVSFKKFESDLFGKVVPKDGDLYQLLAMDSLMNNQITVLRGSAGSGKSYLACGYMFDLLEKEKIDKIIIFCNTVATKGSAKLGFYPGTRTEKLLDSQIGNFLISKLGGERLLVEDLIAKDKLILLPMSDIRGFDTTGMNAAIYITEAQNLDRELMKLALQRIGEDSICILDGDDNAQVDLSMYAGSHNGLRRVSQVFRGQDFYGEITLQKIHRSKIAEIADEI